jgi:hypothetical protein
VTEVDSGLLISELSSEYEKVRGTGYLAGSDSLFKLAKLATRIFRHSSGQAKLVAYLLGTMMFELAQKDEADSVDADAAARRHAALDQAVVGALAVLRGRSADGGLAAIALVEAFDKAAR